MLAKKKRILLLSEGFGTGHTQAAQALSVGLRLLSPNVQTKVLELGTFLHPTIAPLIFSAYRKTVTTSPKLYGKLYRSQYNKSLSKLSQMALHRIFYAQTAEVIGQIKPDLIVCTHPFPNAVVSRLKRSGLDIPLCTVITDYDAHGTWISRETDIYLVPTPEVKRKLQMRGVYIDKIKVTGIPVHPNFWMRQDKSEIRDKFGLKSMPTALIMGGGWGLVSNPELLEKMAEWRDTVQLIVCMGSNEKARQKLAENPVFQHEHIHLLGFIKEIDELMEVSDLLVTKPGGITCTEGLTKGIQMLFYNPIPGQEEENCQYFIENGFGELIESPATIDEWFHRLTHRHEDVIAKRRRFLETMASQNPADCSRVIIQMIETLEFENTAVH